MKLKIKEFREELGLTQNELAKKINNVQRNVSNWENGTSEPDCETIVKLSEIFNVSIDELFGKEFFANPTGIEHNILSLCKNLNESQKYALMQLLKEFQL
ncbi:MAG: helix-turn-helix transcriptional regulator [Clostridia bacterium]|nr:helix-turn-helix transcriptional regulator [Clostridia bacterium]